MDALTKGKVSASANPRCYSVRNGYPFHGMPTPYTSRPSSSRWIILGLAALLVLGLLYAIQTIRKAPEVGAGPAVAPSDMPPAAVYVQSLIQETTENIARATGSLRALSRAEVAAREAGAIIEMNVDEGDVVKKSAVLATLDSRRAVALLAEAQASLTAAESLVRQRQAEASRATEDLAMKRSLLERRAISKSDILDAERALTVAEAQGKASVDGVAQAQGQVDFLTVQLDDHTIRAPFAGVVVERHMEIGEWATTGATVVTLVATDPVEAWLRVPTRYRTSVSSSPESLKIRQSSTGNTFKPAKVTLVPDVEPLSQLFTVVAELTNKDGQFTPGESITGLVPVSERAPHWKVSVDAILRASSGDFLYVAGPDDTAVNVPVEVAFERDGTAFILVSATDLRKDSQVVVEGNERLQPGQTLMIRERDDS